MTEEKRVAAVLVKHSLQLLACGAVGVVVVAASFGIAAAIATALLVVGAALLATRP